MTHLGNSLEYVPKLKSTLLNGQVVKLDQIYDKFKSVIRLNASFLDEMIFRFVYLAIIGSHSKLNTRNLR